MRTIALLLATVQATKLASKVATKGEAQQYGSWDMSSFLANFDAQSYVDAGYATQADLDQFNNAVGDYNTAVNDYEATTGNDYNLDSGFTGYDYGSTATSTPLTSSFGSCSDNDDKTDDYGDSCYDYTWNQHWCGHTAASLDFDSNRDCCACQ